MFTPTCFDISVSSTGSFRNLCLAKLHKVHICALACCNRRNTKMHCTHISTQQYYYQTQRSQQSQLLLMRLLCADIMAALRIVILLDYKQSSSSLTVTKKVFHSEARAVCRQQTVRHASCRYNIRGDVIISRSTTHGSRC